MRGVTNIPLATAKIDSEQMQIFLKFIESLNR